MGQAIPPGRPKLLVVEDDAIIRMDLASELSQAGFDVIEVASADDAIAVLVSSPDIRVMITDVEMAGSMDGIRLAWVVRERWPPVHLIVVSGRKALAEQDLPLGSLFLGKPYDIQHLITAMRRLLN
jgi:CheY-like chemotaxis protein